MLLLFKCRGFICLVCTCLQDIQLYQCIYRQNAKVNSCFYPRIPEKNCDHNFFSSTLLTIELIIAILLIRHNHTKKTMGHLMINSLAQYQRETLVTAHNCELLPRKILQCFELSFPASRCLWQNINSNDQSNNFQ